MSNISQFLGGGMLPPTSLLYTSGSQLSVNPSLVPGELVTTGSLVADTYPTIPQIDISGIGVFNLLTVYSTDSTARTTGVKIVFDGAIILETSFATSGATGKCLIGAAAATAQYMGLALDQLPFYKSAQVFVKSTLTEVDKMNIKYIARIS